MDDLRNNRINPGGQNNKPADVDSGSAPIPFDDKEYLSDKSVSRVPVNLGTPGHGKVEKKVTSSAHVTGVKTFFTKLHEGSIEFIDERINEWLAENPGIVIKRTNTATGIVTGKKSEPSILITVWY